MHLREKYPPLFCRTVNCSCVGLPWSYGMDLEPRQLLCQGQCGDVRDPLVSLVLWTEKKPMNIAPSPSVSIITVLWKQASTSPGWFLRPEIPWFSPSLLNSLFPHAKTFPASVKKKVPSLPHDTEAMVAPLGISTWKNQRIESTFELTATNTTIYIIFCIWLALDRQSQICQNREQHLTCIGEEKSSSHSRPRRPAAGK